MATRRDAPKLPRTPWQRDSAAVAPSFAPSASEDASQWHAMLGAIAHKEAKLDYLCAHAKATGRPYALVLLELCEQDHISAADDDLLRCITQWPERREEASASCQGAGQRGANVK